jgi:uncharacterized membrane protein (DUF4010 family)
LVGLQRERVEAPLAGFRTFALVTVLGTASAHLALAFGGWVVAAGVAGLTGLIAVGNALRLKAGTVDPGITTEVAVLLMYGIGALLVVGPPEVAIVLGGGVAVLLHLKPELHGFAGSIGDDDFRAMMRFALITLVVLPVLPDRAYGPYDSLNPRETWLMVVLIVGIGLGAYLGYKLFGERAGLLLAGVLGGTISSTATTVTYSRRAASEPATVAMATVVLLLASGVGVVRVLIEIAVVAPGLLRAAAAPLGILLAAFAVLSLAFWLSADREGAKPPAAENPAELKPALVFGALYAVIRLAATAAREQLGVAGLYAVGALSGLTDMDAITLSTAQLVAGGQLAPDIGWRVVTVAALSNLTFKAGIVAALGHRRLFLRIALLFGAVAALGVLLLVAWPS